MNLKLSANDWGLLVLRVGVGLVMLYFGCQKMFGIFGGPGFSGTLSYMGKEGFPALLATLAIFAEFFGALGILAGLLTRVAAFGVFCTMVVATYVSAQGGTLGKVFSASSGMEGPKLFFPLILAFASLALIVTGPGALALDGKIGKRPGKKKS